MREQNWDWENIETIGRGLPDHGFDPARDVPLDALPEYQDQFGQTGYDPILEEQPIEGGYHSTSGSGDDPVSSLIGGKIDDGTIYQTWQRDDEEDVRIPVATIEDDTIYQTWQRDDDEDVKIPVASIEDDTIYPSTMDLSE